MRQKVQHKRTFLFLVGDSGQLTTIQVLFPRQLLTLYYRNNSSSSMVHIKIPSILKKRKTALISWCVPPLYSSFCVEFKPLLLKCHKLTYSPVCLLSYPSSSLYLGNKYKTIMVLFLASILTQRSFAVRNQAEKFVDFLKSVVPVFVSLEVYHLT